MTLRTPDLIALVATGKAHSRGGAVWTVLRQMQGRGEVVKEKRPNHRSGRGFNKYATCWGMP